jgi:hypothetical protein
MHNGNKIGSYGGGQAISWMGKKILSCVSFYCIFGKLLKCIPYSKLLNKKGSSGEVSTKSMQRRSGAS